MEPTTETPLLLRGDILNWLRPECVLRPPTGAIIRRARVALQALDLGRVELAESFLRSVLERLAERPSQVQIEDIVGELKGASHGEVPDWPGRAVSRRTLPLGKGGRSVPFDLVGLPGGSVVALCAQVGRSRGSAGPARGHRWRLVWIDLVSLEVNQVRTLAGNGGDGAPVLFAPGIDDEAPLAVIYGSVVVRFDLAGRTRVTPVPALSRRSTRARITAAALHPDNADLLIAVQLGESVEVLRVGENGASSSLLRFPGQIDRFAVGRDLVIGIGLRDIIAIDLALGRTALRDLYPYFADQPARSQCSAIVDHEGSVLVHEGRKVLRVSRDLKLIESEYLLPDAVDRIVASDHRLVRARFLGAGRGVELSVEH